MSYYQLSVKTEWSHEQMLKALNATAATGYREINLVLPPQGKALQTLDQLYSLRKTGRELSLDLTISGGNKTVRGLARLLGFRVIGMYPEDGVVEQENNAANPFWSQPEATPAPASEPDTALMLAMVTIKTLLISKGIFSEEEYQQMFDFVEQQWKGRAVG